MTEGKKTVSELIRVTEQVREVKKVDLKIESQ